MKTTPLNKQAKSQTAKPNGEVRQERRDPTAEERPPVTQRNQRDTQISPEMIQHRAYLLYEQRVANGQQPDNLSDWLEAERQLRSE